MAVVFHRSTVSSELESLFTIRNSYFEEFVENWKAPRVPSFPRILTSAELGDEMDGGKSVPGVTSDDTITSTDVKLTRKYSGSSGMVS